MSPFANSPKPLGFASFSLSDGTLQILASRATNKVACGASLRKAPPKSELGLLANRLMNKAG